jgi:hypothetical protein
MFWSSCPAAGFSVAVTLVWAPPPLCSSAWCMLLYKVTLSPGLAYLRYMPLACLGSSCWRLLSWGGWWRWSVAGVTAVFAVCHFYRVPVDFVTPYFLCTRFMDLKPCIWILGQLIFFENACCIRNSIMILMTWCVKIVWLCAYKLSVKFSLTKILA